MANVYLRPTAQEHFMRSLHSQYPGDESAVTESAGACNLVPIEQGKNLASRDAAIFSKKAHHCQRCHILR